MYKLLNENFHHIHIISYNINFYKYNFNYTKIFYAFLLLLLIIFVCLNNVIMADGVIPSIRLAAPFKIQLTVISLNMLI